VGGAVQGGRAHTDLLRRLAHWLMKEPDLEGGAPGRLRQGLKAHCRRRSMEDGVPPVQVSAPGGESSEVTLEKAGPGLWRSTVDVKVRRASTRCRRNRRGYTARRGHAGIEDAREMSEVTATEEKLKPLIESTGGGTFWTRGGGLLSRRGLVGGRPAPHLHAGQRPRAGGLGRMGLKDPGGLRHRGVS